MTTTKRVVCGRSEMVCASTVRTRESSTQDMTHLRPLSCKRTFPGSPCPALWLCCNLPFIKKQIISVVSEQDVSTLRLTWGNAWYTEVFKSSKKGSATRLPACVFYCILNLFEKMYDKHLAVFLHVCSNKFYTIKGLYCQSWNLLFRPAQHSSLSSL